MKAILALFTILAVAAVANAASGYIGFSAYQGTTDAVCNVATALVGGSGGALSAHCAASTVYPGRFDGYSCSDNDNANTVANCTDNACTVGCTITTPVTPCTATVPGTAYLYTKCYAAFNSIPVKAVGTPYYRINTFAGTTCGTTTPVKFVFAPVGQCIPNPTALATQTILNSCNVTGTFTTLFNSSAGANGCTAATRISGSTVSGTCTASGAVAIQSVCLVNSTSPTTQPTAAPTKAPSTGASTGNTNSAVALSVSAFIVFIASVLVAAF